MVPVLQNDAPMLEKGMSLRHQESSVFVEIPTDPELKMVFRSLANSPAVDDAYFDRIYPEWVQSLSRVHWTPLPVIRRAVDLLTHPSEETRLLDAGSGAGKFCLAGAYFSSARFFGVEQRPHFVQLSRRLAQQYQVPRVTFIQANLEELDWSRFNSVYLYNPFQEFKTPYQKIDDTIELDRSRFDHYVSFTQDRLARMPVGARVVTYHGFGGTFPEGYSRIVREYCYRGPLEYWQKQE